MNLSRKFLGIDYGTKRIGVAVSDENGQLAFPKEIIQNNTNTFTRLEKIIKKENVGGLVVGESVDFSGKLNSLSSHIEVFIKELAERFDIPVRKQKEFLTTVEARRYTGLKHADAAAAALILQRYLDKMNLSRAE